MRRLAVASAFGFLVGYVNVITLIRYGAFAAALTGNLIMIAYTFFRCHYNALHPKAVEAGVGEQGWTCFDEWWEALFCAMIILSNLLGVCLISYVLARRDVPFTASAMAPWLGVALCSADALQEWGIWHYGRDAGGSTAVSQWAVLLVAAAMGATTFITKPAAPGSRLKVVADAATAHLQGIAAWARLALCDGTALAVSGRDGARLSCAVVSAIALGTVVGALCLTYNPLAPPEDRWLFTLVTPVLFGALHAHDRYLMPPPVSNQQLLAPLVCTQAAEPAQQPTAPSQTCAEHPAKSSA